MSNALSEYIEKYNGLIERAKKGTAYLDNPNVPAQEKERWIGEFQKIIRALNDLIRLTEKELGRKMTDNEILNGFTGVERSAMHRRAKASR